MKSSLETGAGGGAQEIVEEHTVHESEPAASSTPSEEERTVMSELFKPMALLCSVYDVEFKNLMNEHGLGVGEDLSRKLDFELADSTYNVR